MLMLLWSTLTRNETASLRVPSALRKKKIIWGGDKKKTSRVIFIGIIQKSVTLIDRMISGMIAAAYGGSIHE